MEVPNEEAMVCRWVSDFQGGRGSFVQLPEGREGR